VECAENQTVLEHDTLSDCTLKSVGGRFLLHTRMSHYKIYKLKIGAMINCSGFRVQGLVRV
jgi:hypothetical protein